MSIDSRVGDLELAIRSLSRVVDNLVAQVAEIERHLDFHPGYWVLVAEEHPFGIGTGIPHHRFRELESGPPEIPSSILDYGSKLWEGPGPFVRSDRAWRAGFWAALSLVCCTSYQPAESIPLWDTIWVVLRARGISRPVIVQSWGEVERLTNLPGSRVDPIIQGFPSYSEVCIFCAGGGINIPGIYQWKNGL